MVALRVRDQFHGQAGAAARGRGDDDVSPPVIGVAIFTVAVVPVAGVLVPAR